MSLLDQRKLHPKTEDMTMKDFNAGMEFAAKVAESCTTWYEGHGDKVGEIAAAEIRARVNQPPTPEADRLDA